MNAKVNKSTILVLTDFSSSARNAADYALQLAEKFEGDLLLFHSYFIPTSVYDSWPSKDYPAILQKSMDRLQDEAKRLENLLSRQGSKFLPRIDYITEGGTVAENVMELITQKPNIMMVVMGGYKAHHNDDFLFGTAIGEVLGKAKCPAVIVPECEFAAV
jgi:nucleotide-binding universal stress UspA family protein